MITSEREWRTDAPPIGAVIECKWYHEEALRVCEVVQLPNDRPGRYLLYDQATGQHYDARCAEKWRALNGHTHVIASATPNVQCTAHTRRPPIGVKPEYVWLSERIAALRDAVARYEAASVTVPETWLHELSRHENALALRKVTFTERVEI